jgi:hypothetical protein
MTHGPARLASIGDGRLNPDAVGAIARLRRDHVLTDAQAALFDRVARRRLASVRLEIRALLYAGVLLLTAGVGLLVKDHRQELGPWVIAVGITLAVAACLIWATRRAAPFSWGEVPSPNVAFDYVLLLGLLLFASELAYVEVEFALLGPKWPEHLLLVGIVYLVGAYLWDSRTVLGLALTTLAAWRGVSLSLIRESLATVDAGSLRANAVVLGVLYVAAAALSVRAERKAHFEEVFANAGLLLLLGGLVSGVLGDTLSWGLWLAALLAVAGLVMWLSFRLGRPLYFVQGVIAAYVGLLRLLFEPSRYHLSGVPFFLAAILGVGVLALIFAAHRRMSER